MEDPVVAAAVRIVSARCQAPLRVEIIERSFHLNQTINLN